jgi:WD40 repeat protein
VWDVAGRRPLGELRGHSDYVHKVAFSPNGKILASTSDDYTVRLWDVESRQPLGDPLKGHDDSVNGVAFSPDGKTLATGSDDDNIILWDLDPEHWATRLCTIANRNLSMGEWQQFIGAGVPYRRTCQNLPDGEGVKQK